MKYFLVILDKGKIKTEEYDRERMEEKLRELKRYYIANLGDDIQLFIHEVIPEIGGK